LKEYATMQVSVADIKARFTAIARQADAGQEVIITNRSRPAYRLLPIIPAPQRSAFPDTTALAMQSKPSQTLVNGSFVADWRAQNERF
jgi:prevent-host-death family protein